jgi:hypothetical protein
MAASEGFIKGVAMRRPCFRPKKPAMRPRMAGPCEAALRTFRIALSAERARALPEFFPYAVLKRQSAAELKKDFFDFRLGGCLSVSSAAMAFAIQVSSPDGTTEFLSSGSIGKNP